MKRRHGVWFIILFFLFVFFFAGGGGVDFWLFTSLQLPFGLTLPCFALPLLNFWQDSDHLKLIDFGFSYLAPSPESMKVVDARRHVLHRVSGKIWHPNTTMAVSCGTLAYVAPEVLEKSYTSQCYLAEKSSKWIYRTNFGTNKKTSENRIWGDLWSLGVVAFVLLFGPLANFGPKKRSRCCCNQRVELGYMPFSGAESKQIRDIKDWNDLKFPHLN